MLSVRLRVSVTLTLRPTVSAEFCFVLNFITIWILTCADAKPKSKSKANEDYKY